MPLSSLYHLCHLTAPCHPLPLAASMLPGSQQQLRICAQIFRVQVAPTGGWGEEDRWLYAQEWSFRTKKGFMARWGTQESSHRESCTEWTPVVCALPGSVPFLLPWRILFTLLSILVIQVELNIPNSWLTPAHSDCSIPLTTVTGWGF